MIFMIAIQGVLSTNPGSNPGMSFLLVYTVITFFFGHFLPFSSCSRVLQCMPVP